MLELKNCLGNWIQFASHFFAEHMSPEKAVGAGDVPTEAQVLRLFLLRWALSGLHDSMEEVVPMDVAGFDAHIHTCFDKFEY